MKPFSFAFAFVCAVLTASVARAVIDPTLQMQLGNPSAALATPGTPSDPTNHNHWLVTPARGQYALDFSDNLGEPNWVSWDLSAVDLGSSGRSPNFLPDPDLPAGFYAVVTSDYTGSGYDRGHMCPSADRTITANDNLILFYLSNILPQAPDNNQGVWASFETYCRTLASAGNEVLITSGPSLFAGSRVPSGKAAIPGFVWKIAVVVPNGSGTAASRITAATRVIAIKIPNVQGVRSNPWQQYVTSVAQIEADTGFTFFTSLSGSVRTALRTVVDGQTSTGLPTITTQPTGQTAAVGGSATFSVTATSTTDTAFTYQWSKDDLEIIDATNSSLTLTNVQAADLGNYTVVVTNSVGAVTSSAAALVITGLPPTITTQPVAKTVGAGTNTSFSVAASGSPTLTYQWRKGGVAITSGNGAASATTATLQLTNVQSADAANYDVVVTNSVNTATSAAVALAVTPAAPGITTQPAAQTVAASGTAAFTVVASGTSPLTYQWRKGGVAITSGNGAASATTATLTLTNVASGDAGSYDVVVSNGVGSPATSSAATLTVSTAAAGTQTNYAGGSYTQNFDTLPSTGTFTLSGVGPVIVPLSVAAPTGVGATGMVGWTMSKYAGTGTATAPLFTVNTGASTSGSVFSYGVAGTNAITDRALGSLSSGSTVSRFGLSLVNTTGQTITQFTLAYTGEQWRRGSAAANVLTFGYLVGGSDINTGTFTAAAALNFTAPVTTGSNATLDGNATANRTAISSTVTGLSWAPGQVLVLRWTDVDDTGSDDGLGIDDLTFSTPVAAAPFAPAVTSTTPANSATAVPGNSPITVTFNQAVTLGGSWFTINSALSGGIAATVTTLDQTTFTLTPPANFADNDTITVTIVGSQITDTASGTLHAATNTTFSFVTAAPIPPSITTQPAPLTRAAGSSATFTVVASGTAPLGYQWRKGGIAITGNASANTATLTLANVQAADIANYDVVVTNGVNPAATSTAVALTVTPAAPTITTQPLAQTISLTGSATFTVAATGTAPLTYQWRKGGVPITSGNGAASATTATLTLTNAQVSDGGNYDVIVSNGVNPSATSTAVALTVSTAVLNTVVWDFTTADPTSGMPSGVTGGTVTQGNNNGTTTPITAVSVSIGYTGATGTNNAGAAARIGALVQAGSPTTGSAYFEFTLTPAAGNQVVASAISFGTRSTSTGPQAYGLYSSADNFAAPIASGTIANNSTWTLQSPALTTVTSATATPLTFRLFGYNGAGSPAAGTANWRIDDLHLTISVLSAPAITTQPAAQTAVAGSTATFTVTATGTPTPTYQWQKAGVAIAGNSSATTATLTLPNVTMAAAGNYGVVVTNSLGTTTSGSVALTVTALTTTVTLASLSATFDGNPHAASATTVPANVPLNFTYNGSANAPTAAGSYSVVASTSDANYSGSASGTLVIGRGAASVTLDNLNQTYSGTPKTVSVSTSPVLQSANYLAVTYNGSPTAPTNAGTYAVSVTINDPNLSGTASGTLVIAKAAQTVTLGSLPAAPVVGTAFTLNATASSGLTPIAFSVVSGNATVSGASVTLNDAAPVTLRATQAGNDNYTSASADATVTAAKLAQTITFAALTDKTTAAAPFALSATASSGLAVSFTVVSGPASISGSTLTLAGTAGTVVVRASQAGNVTYTAAPDVDRSLVVTAAAAAPVITTQPASQVALVGASVSFSVVATGAPAPTYQWRKDGAPIANATGATLSLSNVQAADAAGYDVVVTNPSGGVTSASAHLTVNATATAPVITRQPESHTALAGRSTSFSVVALGAPTPTYQWRKDGTALPGAIGSTLFLDNVTSAQAGSYSVLVSNSAGSVPSNGAVLTVLRHSYAGTYFGTLGNGGRFAIIINDDNTGVFLAFDVLSAGGVRTYVSRALTVDDNGHFHFAATGNTTSAAGSGSVDALGLEASPPQEAAVDDSIFDGSISDSGALTASGPGLSLSAAKSADGATTAVAGFYQTSAAGSSAQTLVIVSPVGQAFALTQNGATTDAGTGTVDPTGRLTVTTASAQAISGTLSAATSGLSATVTDARGATTTFSGFANTSAALASQRLVNISTRASAGTGAQVAIVGFVITGVESKPVLLRAVGPALRAFGLTTALTAPRLDLMSGSTVLATNTGWGTASNATEMANAATRSGAFPLAAGSADSVILITLAPGNYTAIVSASDARAGVGLVEVYDLSADSAAQRLANISTRAVAGNGDNTLIAGVVVSGAAPKRVLIRAAGPALAQFGLTGVLARPVLTLYAGSTVIAQNTNWSTSADAAAIADAATRVGAFAFPAGSADAALIVNLAPGNYTAQVTGVGGTTGVALVEVYELP